MLYCTECLAGMHASAMQCRLGLVVLLWTLLRATFCGLPHRVEKGVLTIMIRKTEGARPNIKDVFID